MANCIRIPRILIPDNRDMTAWSVIACDQFTSDKEYWEKLKEFVKDKPSALNIILPEVYLKEPDVEARIKEMHACMKKYIADGVLKKLEPGFILVERTTPFTPYPRFGVMLSIDLEEYSYKRSKKASVTATEATVSDRIPIRIKTKRGACLDMPHLMLLYDDPENYVLNDVIEDRESLEVLYDFDLNMNGGHVKGYFIPADTSEEIRSRFYSLIDEKTLREKYSSDEPLLFAVGDGNHSLAAAKAYWEEKKENMTYEEKLDSPARFVLAEAVNIYSPAISFNPIYRFVRVSDKEKFFSRLESYTRSFNRENSIVRFVGYYDVTEVIRRLDSYAKAYVDVNGGSIDFIHGEEELKRLVETYSDGIGFILNAIDKASFFRHIVEFGNLPQKTFSMGRGEEKRYYLECKEV